MSIMFHFLILNLSPKTAPKIFVISVKTSLFFKKKYYFIQKIALKNNWFIVQHVWGYPKGESSEKVKSFKKYSQYETEIHGPGVGGGEKDSIQEMKD